MHCLSYFELLQFYYKIVILRCKDHRNELKTNLERRRTEVKTKNLQHLPSPPPPKKKKKKENRKKKTKLKKQTNIKKKKTTKNRKQTNKKKNNKKTYSISFFHIASLAIINNEKHFDQGFNYLGSRQRPKAYLASNLLT